MPATICPKCGHLEHKSRMHQNICTQYVSEHGAECGCSYQSPQPAPAEAERKALEAMNPFQRQLRIGGSTQAELAGNPEPDHQPVSAEEFENDMRTVQRANALEGLLAAAEDAFEVVDGANSPLVARRLLSAIAKCRGLK